MVEVKTGYHENGNVMYEIPCINGEYQGVVKEYDKNGNVIKETPYENGKLKKIFNNRS